MIDKKKKYWLYIYPNVYVVIDKSNEMLLYNTENGELIEISQNICMNLINDVHERDNLGVIALEQKYLENAICLDFIEDSLKKRILGIIEIDNNIPKPIILLPVLNLQRDVDRMKGEMEPYIGDKLLYYLTEINIYLNNECNNNCPYCNLYSRQTKSCTRDDTNTNMSVQLIKNILLQAQYSSVKKIYMLGGNLLLYPCWTELKSILESYNDDYEYHYWVHYKQMSDLWDLLGNTFNKKFDVLINFPVDKDLIFNILNQYNKDKDVAFHFLIENETQYQMVKDWISTNNLKNAKVMPFYVEKKLDFFKNNVFVNKEDIFSSIINYRKIFCNQKLNSNDFGNLFIFPDGTTKANFNRLTIGNIEKDSLMKIIYNELITNTSWRKVRSEEPCNDCLYQFLCPPPSNYEFVIGKNNLCHVKP
jgi:pseudo-rSAM protein